MMKRIPLVVLLCLSLHFYCNAQKGKKLFKRPFNLGIFTGLGGVNFSPIPGVDVHYKGNILRFAPGKNVMGGGYIREILRLSNTFNQWYWIGAAYVALGNEKGRYPNPTGDPNVQVVTDFTKGILLTGLKVYFGNRLYSHLQAGAVYTQYQTPGFKTETNLGPYFEFSFGINLWKSFRKPFED